MDTGKDWSEMSEPIEERIIRLKLFPRGITRDDGDALIASRDAWKKVAEELGQGYSYDDEDDEDIIQCVHCLAYVQNKNAKCEDIEHFPDCPIEQLAELQRSEG